MIFKKTWLNISDNTNVKWFQNFHLYKGFFRKSTKLGFFVKGSAKIIEPPQIEYKGFKIKFNKKGDILRSIIIRNKFFIKKNDGLILYFKFNNSLIIKKKSEIRSKYIYGPSTILLKRKKILSLFKQIF